MSQPTRRAFLKQSLVTTALAAGASSRKSWPTLSAEDKPLSAKKPARICITLDLEMARNFPTWDETHWDYEKGNLNDAAKNYSLAAAKRVAEAGGAIHFFLVGRALEQANIDWLLELARGGHPIGNHTYDHVNVTASKLPDTQFRFARSPWLVEGQTPAEVIRQNIRLCTMAMKERLNLEPVGFRTPGGFAGGLHDYASVRQELLSQGFQWVSSLYPPHPNSKPGEAPTQAIIYGILAALPMAQPFRYPDGLLELPMSPISDIGAFRNGRWKLPAFLDAIEQAVLWTIERGAVFDFLAHPSCLGVMDPHFETIDLICRLVRNAGSRATLSTLDKVAKELA